MLGWVCDNKKGQQAVVREWCFLHQRERRCAVGAGGKSIRMHKCTRSLAVYFARGIIASGSAVFNNETTLALFMQIVFRARGASVLITWRKD